MVIELDDEGKLWRPLPPRWFVGVDNAETLENMDRWFAIPEPLRLQLHKLVIDDQPIPAQLIEQLQHV